MQNTRTRILDEGLDILSRDGLAGVTLGGLAAKAGMSKSGVFAHFKNKEEVEIALFHHTKELAGKFISTPAAEQAEGLPRLRAVIENWFGWSEKAGLPGGCPVAAAVFELDDANGPVRDLVVQMEADWRDQLSQWLKRAIELGHLRAGLDVDQFIWELSGLYLAHHVASRLSRGEDANRRAKQAVDSLIDRSLPI